MTAVAAPLSLAQVKAKPIRPGCACCGPFRKD
jgi:hypothetical protein